MENRPQDRRYETLYTGMQDHVKHIHERNRSRIKYGTIILILLPLILGLIRWLTDSDKALFLLIWVFCLFAVAIYLIGVEYLDHTVRKSMAELTDEEAEPDSLIGLDIDAAQAREKVRERMEAIHEAKMEELQQTGAIADPPPAAPQTAAADAAPAEAADPAEEGGGR